MPGPGAYAKDLINDSAPAAGDLSAAQYHFAVIDSAGRAALAGAGAAAVGVFTNKADAIDKVATFSMGPVVKITLGATVAAGVKVTSDANGEAVGVVAGNTVLGTLKQGGALNEVVSMIWSPSGEENI